MSSFRRRILFLWARSASATRKSSPCSQRPRAGPWPCSTAIRFLGGWAIPEDKADQLIAGLCAIRDEFNDEKDRFLASYDAAIADWVSRHPRWAKVISASTVSCDTVRAKLGFCWQLFRVAPMLQSAGNEAVQHSGLMEEVEGLANALFTDIAKDADDMWSKVYLGKTTVTHKALSPLRTLQQKLEGLSFVEPHVAPVAELIRTALEKVKRKGNIEGADLLMLQGLVCLLREPDALVVHAQRLIEGHDASTLLWDAALPEQKRQARAHRQPAPVLADSLGLW